MAAPSLSPAKSGAASGPPESPSTGAGSADLERQRSILDLEMLEVDYDADPNNAPVEDEEDFSLCNRLLRAIAELCLREKHMHYLPSSDLKALVKNILPEPIRKSIKDRNTTLARRLNQIFGTANGNHRKTIPELVSRDARDFLHVSKHVTQFGMVYRHLQICAPDIAVRSEPRDGASQEEVRLHKLYCLLRDNIAPAHASMSWTGQQVHEWARSDPVLKTRKRKVMSDNPLFPPIIQFRHPAALRLVISDPWSDDITARAVNTRSITIAGVHDTKEALPGLPDGTTVHDPVLSGPWTQTIEVQQVDINTSVPPKLTVEGDLWAIEFACLQSTSAKVKPAKRQRLAQTGLVQYCQTSVVPVAPPMDE